MAVYLLDDKVLLDGGSISTSEDCCCGCHGITTCTVDFIFSYQDNPTPPIGHAFSGTGTVILDVSSCTDSGIVELFVTVVEHGEFGDTTCVPDALMDISAQATWNTMTSLWDIIADAHMGDHTTVCGATGWPSIGLLAEGTDSLTDFGGLVNLIGTGWTATANFTFS